MKRAARMNVKTKIMEKIYKSDMRTPAYRNNIIITNSIRVLLYRYNNSFVANKVFQTCKSKRGMENVGERDRILK